MEFFEGKTLCDLINDEDRPSTTSMHQIIFDLSHALGRLNSTGIIHNDLKADNVMVIRRDDEYEVKIIDLAHADYEGGQIYRYLPADRILKYPQLDPALADGGPCSVLTDFYSLGVLILEVYQSSHYQCAIYQKFGELLKAYKGKEIDPEELAGKDCENCKI